MSEPQPQAIFADSLAIFRPEHLAPERRVGRGPGFILTVAAHLALLVTFLLGVRVPAPAIPDAKPLAVNIEKRAPVPVTVLNVFPKMMSAPAITVPAPEFKVVSEPPPVLVSVPPAPAAAAPETMAPQLGTAYPDYLNLVRQFIQKELDEQHPHSAAGTAEVFFTIDRAGRILSFKIQKSSGSASVDYNALLLMQKSGALPPMPDNMAGDTFSEGIRITYRARS